MATSRRQALGVFLVGALMASGISGLLRQRGGGLETRPMTAVPGFRYLSSGTLSGARPDPFFGLDGAAPRPRGNLADLFTAPQSTGQVPVAAFSDYNCPYCRVLTKLVIEEADTGTIAVTWHELPLLGPNSVIAARATLAAGLQDAYLPFHQRLMKSRFRPNAAYLETVADGLGLDPERLLRDMEGPQVTARLEASAGLANLFGIYGTPALVVGKTLVLGEIKRRDLRRLIRMEAE